MVNERRIVNKPKPEPIKDVDVNTDNITIKVPSVEERIKDIENYLASADPYIKSTVQIEDIKKKLILINEEITRIAGVQARANSYLDDKLAQIDETLTAIITIVKKHDEDYKELMSDIDMGDETSSDEPDPDETAPTT
jgi:hypothetical protein